MAAAWRTATDELNVFASPPWGAPPHSATVRTIAGSRMDVLQTWAEWWILREADVLLHTPSAFSETAWLFSRRFGTHCVLSNVSALQECTNHIPPSAKQAPASVHYHVEL